MDPNQETSSILYGNCKRNPLASHSQQYLWRKLGLPLDVENTGVSSGYREDINGWSGTHQWLARSVALPSHWSSAVQERSSFSEEKLAVAIDVLNGDKINKSSTYACRFKLFQEETRQPLVQVDIDSRNASATAWLLASAFLAVEEVTSYEHGEWRWHMGAPLRGYELVYFDLQGQPLGALNSLHAGRLHPS